MKEYTCQKKEIKCEDITDTSKCSEFNENCQAFEYPRRYSPLKCIEAKIIGNCKFFINRCSDGSNLPENEQCSFNENYECISSIKNCSYCSSSCSSCKLRNEKATCTLVKNKNLCHEVVIHPLCKIEDENHNCVIKNENTKGTCEYNYYYENTCLFVDPHCKYENICKNNTDEGENKTPEGQKCVYDSTSHECKPIDKECIDYTDKESCNTIENKNG